MNNTKVKNRAAFSPQFKIWLENNGAILFGDGRAALFEAIEETGSIRQAAAKLGMSYRAAWGKLKKTEEQIGFELIERHAGGRKSGAELTPYAKNLLTCYLNYKKDSSAALNRLFQKHFANLFAEL